MSDETAHPVLSSDLRLETLTETAPPALSSDLRLETLTETSTRLSRSLTRGKSDGRDKGDLLNDGVMLFHVQSASSQEFPEFVKIVEVGPRDGLQNEKVNVTPSWPPS